MLLRLLENNAIEFSRLNDQRENIEYLLEDP